MDLTRFTLFFPEKREFFLEGQGIYDFGGASSSASAGSTGSGLTPLLFFSRRIGLNQVGTQNRVVPINAGGRLTGKIGRTTVGLLNVYAGAPPPIGSSAGVHVEQTDRCPSDLPGQPSAGIDRHDAILRADLVEADPPAEEEKRREAGTARARTRARTRAAEVEDPLPLQEELALFRKEQREACQVHLLFVDFDLGEIGVVGEISGQVLRQAVLQIEAGVGVAFVEHGRCRSPISS